LTIEARRADGTLIVAVTDSGGGLAGTAGPRAAGGVGIANLRERLAALYGEHGRFRLEDVAPHGARATIELPCADA
jgi:two-component system, LytTR family, sensor kinase